ncbi:hypothetical protein D8796_07990 [Streptococcus cristatus]|uniref:HTH cro/C1-type domain-containing protein n=1 Tax=Streptococcus cristatus TaxID=45634 RepID=A0A3R9KZB6_STRCR|nr:helix-turn-helix transcriptional regulator [Streptococcus cristatus]RSJ78839.1 hypothetical protein D8795_07350 [Streptococcus cristatus]RSJ78944.1 hypothetical protein D8796_07990 [Streptococcus cristatus]RSJ86578.1 hypothetical protein D8794_03765 [Streptococcus cristatus]
MIKTNFAVLMAERGLKIADVYEDTGISKTTLMALAENTGKGVQFETVDKLCNYLGIELKDFFIYVPYIWEMYFKANDEEKNSDYVVIKLKTKNTEKDYFLNLWYRHPKNYDFPLDDDSFKLWLLVYIEQSDAYDEEDFYSFLSNLPVSMKTAFYSQLLEVIKNNVLRVNNKIKVFCDFLERTGELEDMLETTVLEKGDKIYLSFFGEGVRRGMEKELENTKTLTI